MVLNMKHFCHYGCMKNIEREKKRLGDRNQ